jgi:hypothetical protein
MLDLVIGFPTTVVFLSPSNLLFIRDRISNENYFFCRISYGNSVDDINLTLSLIKIDLG